MESLKRQVLRDSIPLLELLSLVKKKYIYPDLTLG